MPLVGLPLVVGTEAVAAEAAAEVEATGAAPPSEEQKPPRALRPVQLTFEQTAFEEVADDDDDSDVDEDADEDVDEDADDVGSGGTFSAAAVLDCGGLVAFIDLDRRAAFTQPAVRGRMLRL